jgi:hypothetical protein
VMASGLIARGLHDEAFISTVGSLVMPDFPQKGFAPGNGYLVDSTAYSNERGPYVSGRYFRLGPLAVTRVWRSPIELTNPVIQTKITRLF